MRFYPKVTFTESIWLSNDPVLWPPHVKTWLIGKDCDAGRDWAQEEKGMTEDEMAGWHHWLDGYESEWTPGVGNGHGGPACCDSWGHKESDTTEWLNWTELNRMIKWIILNIEIIKPQHSSLFNQFTVSYNYLCSLLTLMYSLDANLHLHQLYTANQAKIIKQGFF